jgi:hypothetical protein
VLLPAADRPAARRPVVEPVTLGWTGTGTVLLVDDERGVREVGQDILEGLSGDTTAESREPAAVPVDDANRYGNALADTLGH